MMMSRASTDRARAISTICCSATDRSDTKARDRHRARPAGDRSRLVVHARPIHKAAEPKRLPPHEDVFGDAQGRDEVEFLVDRDDTHRLRGLRRMDRHRLPIPHDRAGIRLLGPGNDFQQGGFPGPVLAEEAVHLATLDLE